MSTRSISLKKIEKLYGLIENMHAAALQEAASLLHEAEAAIVVQRHAMQNAQTDARGAMGRGDREGYAVAETGRAVGERRRNRLEALRMERERATEEVREVYRASHIQRGQMKTVVEATAAAEQVTASRRTQAMLDDRYLSRLRWSQLQDRTA